MSFNLISDYFINKVIGIFPVVTFDILKGHINNRIFSLIILIFFATPPDFFVLEIYGSILLGTFKKDAQHIHV